MATIKPKAAVNAAKRKAAGKGVSVTIPKDLGKSGPIMGTGVGPSGPSSPTSVSDNVATGVQLTAPTAPEPSVEVTAAAPSPLVTNRSYRLPGGAGEPGRINMGIRPVVPTINAPGAGDAPISAPSPVIGEKGNTVPTAAADGAASIEQAVAQFMNDSESAGRVSGVQGGDAQPLSETVKQEPGDPEASYRAFEGAPPQVGPTTQSVQVLERLAEDPKIAMIFQKYKKLA